MRIAILSGHWSANVGNFYFQRPIQWLLDDLLGADVSFAFDGPSVWSPRLKDPLSLTRALDTDLLILSGPILGSRYLQSILEDILSLKARGPDIAFLSAGLENYTDSGASQAAAQINAIEPLCVLTRDEPTAQRIESLVDVRVEAGMCFSAFLPESVHPLAEMRGLEDSIYVNFDPGTHPQNLDSLTDEFPASPHALPRPLIHASTIQFPSSGSMFTFLGRLQRTMRAIGFRDDYEKAYQQMDFYSDNPYTVLSLINATGGTISNRVHTCAAALAFGKRARYVKNSSRSTDGRFALLAGFGARNIDQESVQLNSSDFELRKGSLRGQVRSLLGSPQ